MFSTTRNNPDPTAANGIHFPGPGENVAAIVEEARKRFSGAEEYMKNVVIARPAVALGAALAAGVVIGWLLKRR
jgi:hypothetical protein